MSDDNEGTKERQKLPVAKFISNPFDIDAAIVKLEKPLKFTKFVSPICLPSCKEELYADVEAVIAGWGRLCMNKTDPACNGPNVLQKVTRPKSLLNQKKIPHICKTHICFIFRPK